MINISVEFIALGLPPIIFIIWLMWYNLSLYRLKGGYKQEKDNGKIGEEHRRKLIESDKTTRKPKPSIAGPSQPKERRVLPTADVNASRKNSKSPRGILKRIRRNH